LYTKTEFMLEGQRRRIPVGALETMDTLLDNKHLCDREFYTIIEHPVLGDLCYAGPPAKMSASLQKIDKRAPLSGEHTHEILQQLGYKEE